MKGHDDPPRFTVGRAAIVIGLMGVLFVPFVNKPIHIDETNYLILAEGAVRDPWRPHRISINWTGETEPAFGILSNPPGIAWYLAPAREAPEYVLHLWMLPWLLLGAWGCLRLGRVFTQADGFLPMIYILTCPILVLAAQAITPDLPVFACYAAGLGGFLSSRFRWPFALLAGAAALFKYSGGTAIPLLVFAGWWRFGLRGAITGSLSAVPLLLLALHDLHAYGQVHLLTGIAWQNDVEVKTPAMMLGNLVAGISMLGGTGVLPVLVWRRSAVVGLLLGAAAGLNACWFFGMNLYQTVPAVVFTAAGGAVLALAVSRKVGTPVLSLWALGGAAFFLTVRFAAARYWAAFLPGAALLAYRNAEHNGRWIAIGITANVLLSLSVAVDDYNYAWAQKTAALKVAEYGTGEFSSHLGWQHYLEQSGWQPLERGAVPAGLYAFVITTTAQLPDPDSCLELVDRIVIEDRYWGPRTRSRSGGVDYHGAGRNEFAPWTFSDEPYEVAIVYRACNETDGAAESPGGGEPDE